MIEISILNGILTRDASRDINPLLGSLSTSFDACNRSRIAQFPWIMAVHLSFIVFLYLFMLPLTFVNASLRDSEHNSVGIEQYSYQANIIYAYVILICYALLG